jgi:hypothetical protein
VEANGPSGALVSYPNATAASGAAVVCTPASGSLFPLGTTLVRCTAAADGQSGSATFTVTVRDTTPPVLTLPTKLAIVSAESVPASDERIRRFLASASATDIVDRTPAVSYTAPDVFPVGETTVVFVATDNAGNRSEGAAVVVVTPTPVGGGGEATPPGNVQRVRAFAGHFSIAIRWRNPADRDFDHVEITRTAPGSPSTVYRGRRTSFVATGLAQDVEYRFVVVAYDKTGHRSAGVAVVAFGAPSALRSPVNGAVVSGRVRIAWQPVPRAARYNLQLWRGGAKKASFFPKRAAFTVPSQWRHQGRTQRLRPGTWRVYVWPYFAGQKRYGRLHVDAQFVRPR